jgi:WD40 repeat protein
MSIDGRTLLASGASDTTVRTWDPATGSQQAVLEGHTAAVGGICIVNLDGRMLLASCADDRTVRIWDPAIGACLQTVPIHHTGRACVYSADLLVIGLTGGLLAIDLSAGLHNSACRINGAPP